MKTWIHDNLFYLTIKNDTGQHSQFSRCFFYRCWPKSAYFILFTMSNDKVGLRLYMCCIVLQIFILYCVWCVCAMCFDMYCICTYFDDWLVSTDNGGLRVNNAKDHTGRTHAWLWRKSKPETCVTPTFYWFTSKSKMF